LETIRYKLKRGSFLLSKFEGFVYVVRDAIFDFFEMRDKEDIQVERIRKKLVIVGDGGVGKTALLMVQSNQPYPEVTTR
jgi:GTPase SAR1 family protein